MRAIQIGFGDLHSNGQYCSLLGPIGRRPGAALTRCLGPHAGPNLANPCVETSGAFAPFAISRRHSAVGRGSNPIARSNMHKRQHALFAHYRGQSV